MKDEEKNRIVLVCIISLVALFVIRSLWVQSVDYAFRSYAGEYVKYIQNVNPKADVSYLDSYIIRNKLITNYKITIMHPFKWTEEQISDDDVLLAECKSAWILATNKKNKEEIISEQTFDERRKTWVMREMEQEP